MMRRMAFWRGPDDQPAWARPALLGIASMSALMYGWRATGNLEIFYAAGVRSMSMSWHNFFFEAFDPRATITLDKLPGAFWIQALSVRIFGVHAWAVVAPQVVEGTLTVLVMYRAVRRLAGPIAAITAAAVLAVSPATVALNRGNISDTLMVLLLVLAADATVKAVTTGSTRSILVAGLWVGLAFQAKMVEAWLVLAAVGVVYLLCASGALRRRAWHLVATGAVVVIVSLSWMTVVTLTPHSGRPYVDGSTSDSVFQQVFVYNGFGRLDQPSPNQLLNQAIGLHIGLSGPAAWNRFLSGAYGRDIGWLIPAGLIILVAGLISRRRRLRDDLMRASLLLWGTWLIVFGVVLSASSNINPYYAAALSPALAGLLGTGAALAWEGRQSRVVQLLTAGIVLVSAGYSAWLLPARGTGLPGWLYPLVIGLGVAAGSAVLLGARPRTATGQPLALLALSTVAVLAVPGVASVSIATNRLGPFDTPFQPSAVNAAVRAFIATTNSAPELLPKLEQARFGAPDLMATQTSALASPFIFSSGLEVLPIGGYAGDSPEPTLAKLQSMIQAGDFHLVLQSRSVTDPRLVWVAEHCRLIVSANDSSNSPFDAYFCGAVG